ncbi:hypothetical protein QVM55_21550 [Pseudomonas monteilii]|jgi:hypothetical protein|uniref:Uncharacterized protein n=2 Tax=Pseudomonas TaxID=286 RepID=A0ABD4YLJ3_9PSED|nr:MULTISPECIES: hypothetical protein [Pseudomonas]QNV69521.1 hypothetical protein F7661_28945 [Pseudomonas sp. CFA]TXG99408.1 MAG: hypothetical protein E6R08_02140 [Nevskiaceae bacterium]MDH0760366.1 hypothetical protein [Pseudomonas juntendi]MDH1917821.1 hypothetical protein [Pseudomonas juntendi]TRO35358.1 hypothetical protein EQ845_13045 [Pseudomonas putida]
MSFSFDTYQGATEIGLSSLGCLSTDGKPHCPRFNKSCSNKCASKCMLKAMTDFPEAKTEILLAGVVIASTFASDMTEVHAALSGFERAIQATCI